ncbi:MULTISPECIES: hypothetical protein [Cyanophyceae]|uniref:hypothetical protein n=1 Tax=Cyanophyceae TaxID=3028117 RepID=UPI0016847C8C|nr:hypothetical protein [Trichocoleus sp. FACHB-40]MBD2006240.1 hypothetical protein [Trichocoleus sp. FACHB-40]
MPTSITSRRERSRPRFKQKKRDRFLRDKLYFGQAIALSKNKVGKIISISSTALAKVYISKSF